MSFLRPFLQADTRTPKGAEGDPTDLSGNVWEMGYLRATKITTSGFGGILPLTRGAYYSFSRGRLWHQRKLASSFNTESARNERSSCKVTVSRQRIDRSL